MSIKLVASDLDGSLIIDHYLLTERTKAAILKLLRRGVYFVPATGRAYSDIIPVLKEMPGLRYYLTSNGGNVLDRQTKSSVCRNCLSHDLTLRILKFLNQYPVQYSVQYDSSSIYQRYQNDFLKLTEDYPLLNFHYEDDLISYVSGRGICAEKIYVMLEKESDREPLKKMVLSCFPEVTVTSSGAENIEISDPSCTKGRGLAALIRHLGLNPEEVAVIGDGENDLTMFADGYFRVAMGNSHPSLLAAADFIAPDCKDEGAALALEKILASLPDEI